jgi:hypothetical protein
VVQPRNANDWKLARNLMTQRWALEVLTTLVTLRICFVESNALESFVD